MMLKGQLRYGLYVKLCLATVMCAFWAGPVFAAQQPASEPTQYKIFALKHISPERGRQYLAQANLGTVSQLPGASVLLVTATPGELTRAAAVLKVVDSEQEFVIKAISSASKAGSLPSNEQIAAEVGDISIGTFASPPENKTGAKAIIDVHKGFVVAIAPAGLFEKIVSAISTIEPSTERVAEEPVTEPVEPNEPNAVATAPEPKIKTTTPKTKTARTIAGAALYEPEPLPNGDEVLNLSLPEKLDIVHLLGLVGEYLNLDYMYDPTLIKGEVTLKLHGKLRGAMRVKDLYPLLESVLKFRGFAMTRKGNLVTIVPVAQVLEIDPTLRTEKNKLEHGDVIITCAFQLKHIDTTSAVNLLSGMKLGTSVTPIPDTATIIVTEYAYRMSRIQELLEMIDKPGVPRQFRFRQLKYTMAKTLAPKVKSLAEQLGTVSITVAATTAAPPVPGMPPSRIPPTLPMVRPTAPAAAGAQPTVYLDADERTNRILMIGVEEQLTVVEGLIESLDVAQQDLRAMKLYKIEFVDADEVKKKLQELGVIGGAVETPSRITGGPRVTAATAEGAQAAQSPVSRTPGATSSQTTEALVEAPQVVVLASTNSLLINATPEQHTQIAAIIKYVDSETKADVIPYKIYKLENQKPEDLTQVLEKLIQETTKDKEGKIEKVVKRTEEEIVIVPDKNTFCLIVYASKKNQEWIGSLIKTLDQRRPQVLIDVTLVEVSRSDLFDLDLQLASKFPSLEPGAKMDVVGSIKEPFLSTRSREVFSSPGTGVGEGFYSDRHIQALLTAMQDKSYGRVLAKPKILVNDGQPGTIKTTDTTNVKLEEYIPGVLDKPDRTISRWEPYTAGITLTITPNISEGELMLLEVELIRSDFGDTPTAGSPPDKRESNIKSTVTVPDGRTIILGGLLKLNQSKGGSKIPILGDIPVAGGLFRSTSNTDRESKLYVFVKANILRPNDVAKGLPDLEKISDVNKMAFQKFEDEFQGYKDWPGIKPRPMNPQRVLEVE